jgi:hypothetical protein
VELAPPPNMGRECRIIEGGSLEDKAANLAAVFMEIR